MEIGFAYVNKLDSKPIAGYIRAGFTIHSNWYASNQTQKDNSFFLVLYAKPDGDRKVIVELIWRKGDYFSSPYEYMRFDPTVLAGIVSDFSNRNKLNLETVVIDGRIYIKDVNNTGLNYGNTYSIHPSKDMVTRSNTMKLLEQFGGAIGILMRYSHTGKIHTLDEASRVMNLLSEVDEFKEQSQDKGEIYTEIASHQVRLSNFKSKIQELDNQMRESQQIFQTARRTLERYGLLESVKKYYEDSGMHFPI